jgi:hypothetical protein
MQFLKIKTRQITAISADFIDRKMSRKSVPHLLV